jgi:redox-sensitive bicupin YhaK (pirin superfamily)
MVPAHFTMLWDDQIPRLRADGVEVTVIAGRLPGADAPPDPPPASYASHAEADLGIWHVVLEPGATWTLPRAEGRETIRTLYVFDGTSLRLAGHDADLPRGTGVVVDSQVDLGLSSSEGVEVLVLQGRPLGEPVARYGPFVMTTEAQIQEAFEDYQRTQFGGWPWPDDDPVHPADQGRFARHADGRIEERETAPT